jgi:DNA-binding XRE family transcriptional regulator
MTDTVTSGAPAIVLAASTRPRRSSAPRPAFSAERPARPWIAVVDGARLRRVRREHSLSQEQLSWAAGVSITTIAELEREPRSSCTKRTLALLCDALGEPPAPPDLSATGRAA